MTGQFLRLDITIPATLSSTADIKGAITDMIRLATHLQVEVSTRSLGKPLVVRPFDQADKIAAAYSFPAPTPERGKTDPPL